MVSQLQRKCTVKINWKVCDSIFHIDEIAISGSNRLFAQGPQSIKVKDRIRVFFSTRDSDMPGFFRSQVHYVDLDFELERVLDKSNSPIIALGDLGTYCEHGIFPFNVIQTSRGFIGYVSGWSRRASVSVETSIGIAFGDSKGQRFKHVGTGPILSSCIDEPFLICDPNVTLIEGRYHMWYIFGTDWRLNSNGIPDRTYRIGYANSDDGISWHRQNPGQQIIPVLSENEAQAMPSVMQIDESLFLMCFCYRDTFNFRTGGLTSYRLGGAVSTDLRNWERVDEVFEMSFPEWASEMQCYPNLLKLEEKAVLFFNGNSFGKFGFGYSTISLKELAIVAKLR